MILQELIGRKWIYPYRVEAVIKKVATDDRQAIGHPRDNYIEFWYRLGYDFAWNAGLPKIQHLRGI